VTSVGGSCTDGDGAVSVTLDGNAADPATANCSSGSWSLTLTNALSNEATYAFAASQTDAASNTGTSGSKSVTIDKTGPTVTLTDVNGAARTFPYLTNQDVTSVGGSCEPGGSPVHVTLGGNPTSPPLAPCSPSGSWTLNLMTPVSSDGVHNFAASQVDAVGNPGSSGNKPVQIDKTAPTVTATAVKGDAPGFTGATNYLADTWTNKDVRVTFTCADNTGGSGLTETSANQDKDFTANTTATGATATFSGTCADKAGNSAAASNFGPIKIDKENPVISASAKTQPGGAAYTAGTWTNKDVQVDFSCADDLSGVDTNNVAGDTKTASGADQSVTNTGSCTDKAGNSAESKTFSDIDIDKDAPTGVAFQGGGLSDGASYDFGTVPNAPTGCTASDVLSGVKSCSTDANTTYKTTVGTHTITATAEDNAGNKATKTLTYTVKAATAYGFYQPIDMSGTLNTVKSGSTVPVKFELFGGASNTEQKSLNAVSSISARKVDCGALTGAPTDAIEYLAPTSEPTVLRFDTTGDQFIYNWKTPAKAANTCYSLTMTAADNTTKLVAYFQLK
jgi:Bacterial Ig-like domain